jgi:uncharacterized protein YicC (UPF0701 family)
MSESHAEILKALQLFVEGRQREGRKLIRKLQKDGVTVVDAAAAIVTQTTEEIRRRHNAADDEPLHALLTRAADAGDEEARILLACGVHLN